MKGGPAAVLKEYRQPRLTESDTCYLVTAALATDRTSTTRRSLDAMREFFQKLTSDVEREGTNTIVFESRTKSSNIVPVEELRHSPVPAPAFLPHRGLRLLGTLAG